jgi:hypothetical protein
LNENRQINLIPFINSRKPESTHIADIDASATATGIRTRTSTQQSEAQTRRSEATRD